ncbi:MAG: caspase family protein [Deltaproteobacteria bacterium]|nr:caspase family protein [Deltaproteobacteria bacterium]
MMLVRQKYFGLMLFLAAIVFINAGLASAEQRYAIIVGHNLGHPGEDPLRFAERDAKRFRDLLTELGGVDKDAATLLLGPNTAEIKAAVYQLAERIRSGGDQAKNATVIFFFAGHGDSSDLHLAGQKLERKELLELLKKLPCSMKLVVLDACQTTRLGRSRGVKAGPSFEIGVVHPKSAQGMVVIRSTQAGEPAHESDALEGAVFTHYLLSALRGAADLDHDGRITLLEAYTFAYRNTVRQSAQGSSVVQHPSYEIELAGSGDLVLTTPLEASCVILLPVGQEARYLVFHQPSGAVLAEAVSSSKRPLALAVPPGRLLVQRRLSQKFEVAEVVLPFGGQYKLAPEDFIELPYEKVARRGGRLDLHPDVLAISYSSHSDRIQSDWVTRHGFNLAYNRELGQWLAGAQLAMGFSAYQRSLYETDEILLELRGQFGWWTPVSASRLEISVGPEVQILFQNRQRADAERLRQAGISVPDPISNFALGAGGGIELAWRMPLGYRIALFVAVRVSVFAMQVSEVDSKKWTAIPVVGGKAGIGYRF